MASACRMDGSRILVVNLESGKQVQSLKSAIFIFLNVNLHLTSLIYEF